MEKIPGLIWVPWRIGIHFCCFHDLAPIRGDSGFYFLFAKERKGFSGGTVVKNLPANAGDTGSIPGLGRSLGEVFLPGKPHRQRSPAGYSPCGCRELDMTEHRPYAHRESQVTPSLKLRVRELWDTDWTSLLCCEGPSGQPMDSLQELEVIRSIGI